MDEIESKQLVIKDFETFLETFQPVPEEIVQKIVEEAEGQPQWIKFTAQGFTIGDIVVPRLQGVITKITTYFLKFENNEPDRLDSLEELSPEEAEEYDRRCDIHLMTTASLLVGISMAKTSYYGSFAPFIKMLSDRGCNPSDVLIDVWTTEKKNKFGKYAFLNFKPIRFLKEGVPSEDIPF
jgi:hypothetical protein